MKKDLTAQRLRELLDYDPNTGVFTWRRTGSGRNTHPGCLDKDGYHRIGLDYRMYKSHRLAWLHVFGTWPAAELDHINRVKTDNRIANLRECTNGVINKQNTIAPNTRNKSGFPGVFWYAKTKKWRTQITNQRKQIHLGYYETVEEASAVYLAAKRRMHRSFTE